MKEQLQVGDEVYVDGYTSMAQQNAENERIKEVRFKYDEESGERYPIYKVAGAWYDGRDGSCHSNKKSMYFIDLG